MIDSNLAEFYRNLQDSLSSAHNCACCKHQSACVADFSVDPALSAGVAARQVRATTEGTCCPSEVVHNLVTELDAVFLTGEGGVGV